MCISSPIAGLLAVFLLSGSACAQTPHAARAGGEALEAPGAAGAPSLAGIIEGIVHYTRWPTEASPIVLCVLGDAVGAAELLGAGALGSAQRPIILKRFAASAAAARHCHAIYFASPEASRQRELLLKVAAEPILTIGDGAGFCSDGGMFCIEHPGAPVRFGANLDAIARSGLRTNPQVLWLARPRRGSGS